MNDNEWKTLIALGVVNCYHAAHFYTIEFIEDRSAEMAGQFRLISSTIGSQRNVYEVMRTF